VAKKKSAEELLKEVNSRLRSGKAGVTVSPVGGMLYLRATLPPKPGSNKQSPYQQRISLGVRLNPPGVKRAEAEALKLSSELALDKFDWRNWQNDKQKQSPKTIADWVKDFETHYFSRRERNPKSTTTWEKDYKIPYARLPQHRQLGADVLIETALTYEPDTRSRQRACTAYGRLAKFAGIDVQMSQYRGRYSPKSVNPRDLPSDEKILELIEGMQNPRWRFLMLLMTIYGLRDHEVFYVDLEGLQIAPGVCTVTESDGLSLDDGGKTGWREVWPYPADWWEKYLKGQTIILPKLTAKKNSDYGMRISQYFKRKKLPIVPYDLRHAWAARTAVAGLDPAIAAKMMGHDLSVHTRVYHQFISRASFQAAWERTQNRSA
jgi:integrase